MGSQTGRTPAGQRDRRYIFSILRDRGGNGGPEGRTTRIDQLKLPTKHDSRRISVKRDLFSTISVDVLTQNAYKRKLLRSDQLFLGVLSTAVQPIANLVKNVTTERIHRK